MGGGAIHTTSNLEKAWASINIFYSLLLMYDGNTVELQRKDFVAKMKLHVIVGFLHHNGFTVYTVL